MSDEGGRKRSSVAVCKAGLMPDSIEGMFRVAHAFHLSGLAEANGLDDESKVFAAIEMGAELGVGPMQAIQNIAVIKGKACAYGDLVLGLVQQSGLLEWITEEPILDGDQVAGYICRAQRQGYPEAIERRYTREDAVRAGLWMRKSKKGEPTPWVSYPQRMLQMRARSWALRDGFADVLKGLQVREEVEDYVIEARVVEPAPSRQAAIGAALGIASASSSHAEAGEPDNADQAPGSPDMEDEGAPPGDAMPHDPNEEGSNTSGLPGEPLSSEAAGDASGGDDLRERIGRVAVRRQGAAAARPGAPRGRWRGPGRVRRAG